MMLGCWTLGLVSEVGISNAWVGVSAEGEGATGL